MMQQLRLYRLIPNANLTDALWSNATNHGEVVVRARSPADARLAAAEAESDFPAARAKPGDDVETAFASAFRDSRLYSVVDEPPTAFPAEGERGIVAGSVAQRTIKPLQS